MLLLPIPTPLLRPGDDLATIVAEEAMFEPGDIIAISSKAVATVENAFIDLRTIEPTEEAREWSRKTGHRSPAFCQAVLDELQRLNGTVIGACPGAMLTEVAPEGLANGSILTANAGLDESNAPVGMAIGWPRDPVRSVRELRRKLELYLGKDTDDTEESNESEDEQRSSDSSVSSVTSASSIAVILTDSCVRPRRLGVTAFALTVAGIDPLLPQAGLQDLFGKELHITTEAVADQLATAANFLMGNAAQSVPAVLIRDHGLLMSDFEGWVPGIGRERDLFSGLL
ncbi:MAG: hypothetical protein Greene041619_507 [Candidatus Peregrinibacteria bacterium Greene0416_19]|nr:MAG: hypothetical protein Greene041619_507 [Candidatus Peregrinibacteria bacterium Greene0416_19]